MTLQNFYYTQKYKDQKYCRSKEEKENKINDDYYIKHKKYSGNIRNKDIIGYERTLYKNSSGGGEKIYDYKSDDSRIFKIIRHSDKNDYFFFNKDLSGFSVLNLNSLKEEINFYNNEEIDGDLAKGILVFVDLEYCALNDRILFYVFYLYELPENAYGRIFSYLIYDFSNPESLDDKNITLIDVRKIISKKYNKNLDFIYKAYFKDADIVVENYNNKESFIIKEKDYIF